MPNKNGTSLPTSLMLLVPVFAIALQIQVSLFASESYIGLRFNLADIFLPFAGLFAVFSLMTKKSLWPKWQEPFGYRWLAILTGILFFALINGYFVNSGWNTWALLNKFTGWFVLMGYMGIGAWISSNVPAPSKKLFIRFFTGFFACILLVEIIAFLLQHQGVDLLISGPSRHIRYIDGLMANRNAFAFLQLCALILTSVCFLYTPPKNLKSWILPCFIWILFPLGMFLNGSRSLWLTSSFFLVILLTRHTKKTLTIIVPFLIIGSLLIPILSPPQTNKKLYKQFNSTKNLYEYALTKPEDKSERLIKKSGDSIRLTIIEDSLELIKKHPFTGAGLGTSLMQQQKEHGKTIAVIDNTALWMLTEMGPIGLMGFLGAYIAMLIALKRKSEKHQDTQGVFSYATLFILLGFGIFSLFHEMLYTRFLWFILGMALVKPVNGNPAKQRS